MKNEINLLKNNDKRDWTDLEWVQEFNKFLQGELPKDISMRRGYKPKLTPKVAFSIIWYLQEKFPIIPDSIERCHNCNWIFDSDNEGYYSHKKEKFYCSDCTNCWD